MLLLSSCKDLANRICDYADGSLPPEETRAVEQHLASCAACRASHQEFRSVRGLLEGTLGAAGLSPDFNVKTGQRMSIQPLGTGSVEALTAEDAAAAADPARGVPAGTLVERLGAAPWWAVSVALHVLVIVLLGLVTMTIGLLESGPGVIVLTNLEKRPAVEPKAEEKKAQAALRDILESKRDTAPTDPDAQAASNIVVPPEILAQAELGDHFETINPDRPDTHSAFGDPEARMFHSASGNDEPEGGGGSGGTSLLDDPIGAGGSASPGTGGGWGGGNGTGTGLGAGAGHGSFGQRGGGGRKLMVMKHGGSKATESAVEKALAWLARNQEPEGRWDCAKHGGEKADTAMTGLALLAFLGAGHTEKVGQYKDNVRRAVEWLGQHQNAEGLVYNNEPGGKGYNHSMASLALAEAAGMARVAATRKIAQKAVDYSVNIHQCGEGSEKRGWRYNPKQEGDLSNSGWFIMQLKSAKVSGLNVPHGGFEGAAWFLDYVELKDYSKSKGAGYATGDEYDNDRHRYSYVDKNGSATSRLTAIGCLCRLFLGAPKEEIRGGILHSLKFQGVPAAGKEDLYYWYYETLCTFQYGGELWKQWNEGLKGALLPTQCVGGAEDGSWNLAGNYSKNWGRAGQTALSCLCLEVYYRYLPMYR